MQFLEMFSLITDLIGFVTELYGFLTSNADFKLGILMIGFVGNNKDKKKNRLSRK